jgi:hypothetical protein
MIRLKQGANVAVLPDPRLGNTEAFTLHHLIGRVTTNDKVRFVDSNWPGSRVHTFVIFLPKCHATFATHTDFITFLDTTNGQPIEYQIWDGNPDWVTCYTGFLRVDGVVERAYFWNFSLQIDAVI